MTEIPIRHENGIDVVWQCPICRGEMLVWHPRSSVLFRCRQCHTTRYLDELLRHAAEEREKRVRE